MKINKIIVKLSLAIILIGSLITLSLANMQIDKNDLPTFEEYKVEISKASPKPIDLKSHQDAKMFRTRLRNASKKGVNFAGHYILTSWGCGTGCGFGAIIDTRTGAVYFPDELGGMVFEINGQPVTGNPLQFKKDSRLLILSGSAGNSKKEGITYLVWEGDKFRQVEFVKEKK